MNDVKPRREIYAETTRRALLETGRQYFLERGYAAVSAEELVRAAGLSRGALYHHFDGKRGLFEAVFEDVQNEAMHRVGRAMAATRAGGDEQIMTGLEAVLDAVARRDYREIVLVQGPVALGRSRWRELDEPHLRSLLRFAARSLLDSGRFRAHPPDLLAGALYGTLVELALTIAESEDPPTTRAAAAGILHDLLSGLSAPGRQA